MSSATAMQPLVTLNDTGNTDYCVVDADTVPPPTGDETHTGSSAGFFAQLKVVGGSSKEEIPQKQRELTTFMITHWMGVVLLRVFLAGAVILCYAWMQMTCACIEADFAGQTFDYWVILWTLLAKAFGARCLKELTSATQVSVGPLSVVGRVVRVLPTQIDFVAIAVFAICTRLFFGKWECINDAANGHYGTAQAVGYGVCLLAIIVAMFGVSSCCDLPLKKWVLLFSGFC
eukprot:TRINITY_DN12692_c0_g3_i1.p1 TRINITY_DN12692_c0_g3~~TRINITY_DN12692_c0_g3_i1.p1  ORF type:complete len:231 (+),score=30.94 TRINITY_DN12692_c0_g3_i1:74-766(+)